MTIFDLVFIGVVLGTVVVALVAVGLGVRRRGRSLVRLLLGYGACLAAYLVVVAVVALTAGQRIVAVGDDRCFDDWCIAVTEVERTGELGPVERPVTAQGTFVVVTLRLSNHGRGRPQRVSSAAVQLRDAQGRRYDVSPAGQAAYEAAHGPASPLTVTIEAGESVATVRVFDVARDARGLGLTVRHPLGIAPGLLIIGDEASLLHRPTLIWLDGPRPPAGADQVQG